MTNDIARLLLRVTVGVMILFHGFDKVINGIGGVKYFVASTGVPEFLAYGVYIGEIVMPILILLGAYARVASLILAFNMAAAIFLAYGNALFTLGKHGAPSFELPLLYLVMSILIFMLGSGKYALNGK
ncbi:MAG: GntR family transcriptional regulator [Sulfurimonas sp. RIFOXYD12_FULL_33_39]|uniref:DoxX family protein n=1 Tax=unclassified Sulfurimonas TaxID=2623549 RepID=UPI0008CBAE51|nr:MULTISPECIES: DoxX family protein [unclassified Sulfurimonas]OHE07792.1 MAG: GntR family transcriptional regulator [Sulfurimonas sp. RIFCSPLOWO2_12_FULL_34_6]OHE09646.1 MAG: GntR family transcriptional regulator [Sulfurimonas sp. RIFOXYD12_FULL_33_39]OHE13846.1 MAG: GntR family transcriptional regulator [Sulfurimonas sp. RIFOXYD2_FULL_34_21]DAB27678.1 MAG TPA: GntR family transcriptional regulator [Sulfurimonas sp. UBA10385]